MHFCWDNNDLNEDTLSGANTTHCTNGILIQQKVQLDQRLAKTAPTAVQWKSKRSWCRSTILPPELHVEYFVGHRDGPRQMMLSEDVLLQLDKTHTKLPITLKKADFVWLLARLRKSNSLSFGQSDSQEVPG